MSDKYAFDSSWDPGKHPRGQPNNKGEFGKGGGAPRSGGSKEDREQYDADHLRTIPVDDLEKNADKHIASMKPHVRSDFNEYVATAKRRAGGEADKNPDSSFLSGYVENLK